MSVVSRQKLVLTPFLIFIRFFKRSRWDNFLGGLVIGAIFSLFVNVATVRIQETISKQRALEALEREITYHVLAVKYIQDDVSYLGNNLDKSFNINNTLAIRFSTKVWDTGEVYKYLLEIDPEIATAVDFYYDTTVVTINRILDDQSKSYANFYASNCKPEIIVARGVSKAKIIECNQIAQIFIRGQSDTAFNIVAQNTKLKENFHPTKDRLNSFWLKLLLGDKSVEILK